MPDSGSHTDWHALLSFPIALGALLVTFLIVWWRFKPTGKDFGMRVEHLDSAWSFSDKLGQQHHSYRRVAHRRIWKLRRGYRVGGQLKNALALATVGAAVAVAFIGAGPIVLLSAKSKGGYFTVVGLLGASAIVLAGAVGELYVVARSATQLDLGGLEGSLPWALFAAAMGLLALYAVTSIPATIGAGFATPEAPPAVRHPRSGETHRQGTQADTTRT